MTVRDRLRVLHLGRFFRQPPASGIERHVATLLKALAQHCEAHNLVAGDRLKVHSLEIDGYFVHFAPCFGVVASTAVSPTLPFWARRLHARHRFDLVHLHFPDPLSHLAALMLPAELPRVVTWHSDIVRQKTLLPFYRPAQKRFMSRVDAVIAACEAVFANSSQLGTAPLEKRHVIGLGLDYAGFDDPAVISEAARLRQTLPPGKVVILSVGRHVYYKGIEYLIEAVTMLPEAYLVLAGSGPLTDAWRKLAVQRGVSERIRFVGSVDDASLRAWYQACDIFCLPSTAPAETFGQVQLEAMACGKPVVSTRLGTCVEFVNQDGQTGFVVPPRDVPALTQSLRRLIENPSLRQALGQRGEERARGLFSAEAMASATLRLYEQILAKTDA
jgi:glycosyltransferase involved in cell wall biosynthesis